VHLARVDINSSVLVLQRGPWTFHGLGHGLWPVALVGLLMIGWLSAIFLSIICGMLHFWNYLLGMLAMITIILHPHQLNPIVSSFLREYTDENL